MGGAAPSAHGGVDAHGRSGGGAGALRGRHAGPLERLDAGAAGLAGLLRRLLPDPGLRHGRPAAPMGGLRAPALPHGPGAAGAVPAGPGRHPAGPVPAAGPVGGLRRARLRGRSAGAAALPARGAGGPPLHQHRPGAGGLRAPGPQLPHGGLRLLHQHQHRLQPVVLLPAGRGREAAAARDGRRHLSRRPGVLDGADPRQPGDGGPDRVRRRRALVRPRPLAERVAEGLRQRSRDRRRRRDPVLSRRPARLRRRDGGNDGVAVAGGDAGMGGADLRAGGAGHLHRADAGRGRGRGPDDLAGHGAGRLRGLHRRRAGPGARRAAGRGSDPWSGAASCWSS